MNVTGPVTGGSHGWPFAGAAFDLAAVGYVEEEWFLAGTAVTYRHARGTERTWDGRWSAVPDGEVPYATRLLVRRPADPADANGTVVLLWNNVSLGFDLLVGDSPEVYDGGFTFVGVTVQRNGVHGYPDGSPALTVWDPDRYGSLSLPTDAASYDIYTQAARVVRDGALGFTPRRVLGVGASQSAVYLATYLNAIQPLSAALDACILDIYFGTGSVLQPTVGIRNPSVIAGAVAVMPPGSHLLRDDLGIPIFVLNSETEAQSHHAVRQPDTDRYRFWEVAGVAHSARERSTRRLPSPWPRDLGTEDSPLATPADANVLQLEPVRSAVLRHVQRWMTDGTPPPEQPRIEFDTSGAHPTIRRDELGIALGGVRLPDVEVPTARHMGVAADGTLSLSGSTTPFDPDVLHRLYPDADGYRVRHAQASRAAVDAGVLRPEDATEPTELDGPHASPEV